MMNYKLICYENNLIRIRIYSKLRHSTKHQVLIAYINQNDIMEEDKDISGYYYTCQSRARTLGTCAHVASVLWYHGKYLGYARHQPYVKYPQNNLLYITMDAVHRADPEDP